MEDIWNRENCDQSFLRTAFSFTTYDRWDSTGGPDGIAFKDNPQMRRLLELEWAIRPVPVWVQKIVRQIEQTPPCGAFFVQQMEALVTNIGRKDAHSVPTGSCYSVGQRRLELLAYFCVCLDAWLKKASSADVAAGLVAQSSESRDWQAIADGVWSVLGARTPAKVLLVRRLVDRLRFWVRAPYSSTKLDDNWRLGYFYSPAMSRYGGWDPFAYDRYDLEAADLSDRITAQIPGGKRWLELIDCTWPCAPKVFRFLERIIYYIGNANAATGEPPNEESNVPGFLRIENTYLASDVSRRFFTTTLQTLAEYVAGQFEIPGLPEGPVDERWKVLLTQRMGPPEPSKLYLAALLLERLWLIRDQFKSFHFTRNVNQVS